IATTNDTNSPQQPSYDISAFAPVGSNASVQVYRTDATSNVTPDSQPFHVADGQFTDLQTSNSVNTYVITLPGPPPGTGPGGVPGTPVNQPPVVSARPDVTVTDTHTSTVTGSATDPDGAPMRVHWTAAPATGTTDPNASCTFVDPANLQTGITCSDEGDYKVTLSADDGFTLPVSS